MDRYNRTHCMTSTLARIEFSVYLLVGTCKTLVYAVPVDSEGTLHHQIVDDCQTACNYPGIYEWMQQSMMRHVKASIESRGEHFEHLL
jgi:hypothetical protein